MTDTKAPDVGAASPTPIGSNANHPSGFDVAPTPEAPAVSGEPMAWMVVNPMLDRMFFFGSDRPQTIGQERAVPLYTAPSVPKDVEALDLVRRLLKQIEDRIEWDGDDGRWRDHACPECVKDVVGDGTFRCARHEAIDLRAALTTEESDG